MKCVFFFFDGAELSQAKHFFFVFLHVKSNAQKHNLSVFSEYKLTLN